VTARMLAPFLEQQLGSNARIVVVNRPGAGGEIGFAALADAAPDGYTIGFINTPNFLSIPIERKSRFKPAQIDPLMNVVDDPGVMTLRADSPVRTLAELVEYARANPKKVAVGTTGVGSDDHLGMLFLQRQAQVQLLHVPFPGGAEAYRSLLGGHTMVTGMNLGEGLRARQSDGAILLGQMAEQRLDLAPDLPTFREQGYDIVVASLRGIGAPRGLPPDIRAALVDALTKAANHPEFQAKARETFQPLRLLDSAAFTAELAAMEKDFRKLWEETPWTAK